MGPAQNASTQNVAAQVWTANIPSTMLCFYCTVCHVSGSLCLNSGIHFGIDCYSAQLDANLFVLLYHDSRCRGCGPLMIDAMVRWSSLDCPMTVLVV